MITKKVHRIKHVYRWVSRVSFTKLTTRVQHGKTWGSLDSFLTYGAGTVDMLTEVFKIENYLRYGIV